MRQAMAKMDKALYSSLRTGKSNGNLTGLNRQAHVLHCPTGSGETPRFTSVTLPILQIIPFVVLLAKQACRIIGDLPRRIQMACLSYSNLDAR